MVELKPLDPERLDHCKAETLRARDIMIAAASKASDDPLRQSSALITMLQSLTADCLVCVGHDRRGCVTGLTHVVRGVGDIIRDHFDKAEKAN